jgi:NAD(P)-dependent dehydrogenase (short-subunit alcohol dehydrogenase family)
MTKQSKAGLFAAGAFGAAVAARAMRARQSMDLRDRVVVITGGSRGLGLVMARRFAAEGARLALLARDEAELGRAREDLESRGAVVLTVRCDVRARDDAQPAIQRVVDHYGRIDVLINNAGIIQVGPLEHMTLADFDDALAVHFWGPLYTMTAAIPHMRHQGGGRIVNISSIGGKVAIPHLVPYSASKFALVGLSDGMRAELARDGIRVTTVCPGLMRTGSPINATFKGQHRSEFTWFAVADALPLVTIDAGRAADKIVEACRRGAAELVITPQARAAVVMNAIAPAAFAGLMMVVNQLLPRPAAQEGTQGHTGWQSQSRLAPSMLTKLSDTAAERNNERGNGHNTTRLLHVQMPAPPESEI